MHLDRESAAYPFYLMGDHRITKAEAVLLVKWRLPVHRSTEHALVLVPLHTVTAQH